MITRGGSLWLMLGILLLAFALGAGQLNADILWVDEMHSVSAFGAANPSQDIAGLIAKLADKTPEHAPLYFVMGAGWAQVVGWSQVALRYLSLLCGILALAWLYRIGVELLGRRSALMAAFLCASNAFVIIYFHELRNYTLWLLLCLLHFWLYWRLRAGGRAAWTRWLAMVLTASAMLYTHVFSLFVLLAYGACHLLAPVKDRRWLGVAIAWGFAALSFLPWLLPLAASFAQATDIDSLRAKADTTIALMPMLAAIAANGIELLWLPIAAMLGWRVWRGRWREWLPLGMVAAAIVIAIIAYHELAPFLSARRLRYFLPALAFALLIIGHLLATAQHWRIVAALFLCCWLAGGWHITRQAERWAYAGHHSLLVPHPPLHKFADALRGVARPQDALLGFTQSSFLNHGLHFGFSAIDYYSRTMLGIPGALILTTLDGDALRSQLERMVGAHPHLLLAYQPQQPPANLDSVKALLAQDFKACQILHADADVFVERYTMQTMPCERHAHEFHYAEGIRIMDAVADYDAQAKRLHVLSGWQVADESLLEAYNLSIQVFDSASQKVLQAPDRHLSDGILPWYALELATDQLPEGDYRLALIVYDRYSGKKLTGVDIKTGQASQIFSPLAFSVSA